MAIRVLTVVGARPQFVKAATVTRVINSVDGISETMIHTGQHFDAEMSEVFFDELGIPEPAHHLDVNRGSHGEMTGRMLERLDAVMQAEKPDVVLVYGDTNSTLAGALAAAKLLFPVAHVEAGLRSFNRAMPEEINKVLTDHLSSLLFCPTKAAVENLKNEGITSGVHQIGDVMFDATLGAKRQIRQNSHFLEDLDLSPDSYSLATIHRAENTDTKEHLEAVLDYLRNHAKEHPVVLPLHPRTRQAAEQFDLTFYGLRTIQPVGYLDMTALLDGCIQVLTNSGGVQKEAYFHRKPCVTLRSETEWVETIEAGWNRLWTSPDYAQRCSIADYGEGQAAEAIVSILRKVL